MCVPRINLTTPDNSEQHIRFTRRQLPIHTCGSLSAICTDFFAGLDFGLLPLFPRVCLHSSSLLHDDQQGAGTNLSACCCLVAECGLQSRTVVRGSESSGRWEWTAAGGWSNTGLRPLERRRAKRGLA